MNRGSRDLFVPRYDSFLMNPEKRHSFLKYIYNLYVQHRPPCCPTPDVESSNGNAVPCHTAARKELFPTTDVITGRLAKYKSPGLFLSLV